MLLAALSLSIQAGAVHKERVSHCKFCCACTGHYGCCGRLALGARGAHGQDGCCSQQHCADASDPLVQVLLVHRHLIVDATPAFVVSPTQICTQSDFLLGSICWARSCQSESCEQACLLLAWAGGVMLQPCSQDVLLMPKCWQDQATWQSRRIHCGSLMFKEQCARSDVNRATRSCWS